MAYLLLILATCLAPALTQAEALLQILPTRVVMDDKTRSVSLTLVNQGNEEASYRMFFRNIRMSDEGKFNIIEEGDDISKERFADKMLRFSPRRISIPPQSKQTIRVVARKPQGLEKGEYRSHMVFRRLPKQQSVLEQTNNDALELAIQPVVEVTIPIIVRHNDPEASVELSQLTVQADKDDPTNHIAQVNINRDGDRSIYGDLELIWESTTGNRYTVGEARGLSVYYPNTTRIFQLPLNPQPEDSPNKINFKQGTLKAIYKENPNYGGNQQASTKQQIN